jgi:GNAT superfamily N-acetyltransferase
MEIRPASASEADELSALAMSAKAHWGYAQALLHEWRSQLSITPEEIRSRPTFVITAHGQITGFYSLEPGNEAWKLEHFWVRPEFMGRGIGTQLLRHALQAAQGGGAARVTVDADPNAAAFYLRRGATKVGEVPAPIPGEADRVRPQLKFALLG